LVGKAPHASRHDHAAVAGCGTTEHPRSLDIIVPMDSSVAWEARSVTSEVPRTVKAVDTQELIRLDAEAIECGLIRQTQFVI